MRLDRLMGLARWGTEANFGQPFVFTLILFNFNFPTLPLFSLPTLPLVFSASGRPQPYETKRPDSDTWFHIHQRTLFEAILATHRHEHVRTSKHGSTCYETRTFTVMFEDITVEVLEPSRRGRRTRSLRTTRAT